MLIMLVWKTIPTHHQNAMQQFVLGDTEAPAGVEIISDVHGFGTGFLLVKSDQIDTVYAMCARWAHLVTIEAFPVIEGKTSHKILKK